MRIPDILVEAVVYHPFAAWPQSSPGWYDADEAHMLHMNQALATAEGTAQYLNEFVYGVNSLDDYLARIGDDVRARLSATATGFCSTRFANGSKPRASGGAAGAHPETHA